MWVRCVPCEFILNRLNGGLTLSLLQLLTDCLLYSGQWLSAATAGGSTAGGHGVRSRCCERLLQAVALGEKLVVREHDELLIDHRSGILAEVIALPRT